MMIKAYLESMFSSAADLNRQNILRCVPQLPGGRLLDLGCDEGAWSLKVSEKMRAGSIQGIEIVEARALQARQKGIEVEVGDLAVHLPFSSEEFDLVHANQVIEHVPDVDLFTSEIYRVLKPGGLAIVSTENASSWHNVAAAALGWQIFSLTNVSERRLGIGNPLALHRGEANHLKSWTHKVIFSHRGLKEFFSSHGFECLDILGAGYYPLPARLGRLDSRHAHFLTLAAKKPESTNRI